MADNVPVTPGVGATIATDDVNNVQFQRVKLDYGDDGVSIPHVAINMDYTGGTTTDYLPAFALAFRQNGNVGYVATNQGLPIDASQTTISIQDSSLNGYLSASATMNQSSGAGLFPAVNVAQFDDVSPTAITEGRFGNLRMSSRRELYVQLRDAAGNERGLNIDANNRLGISIPTASSGGAANVASSATNVTLLASNTSRKGFSIFNDSTSDLYVKFGATASATSFHVKLTAGAYYESPAGFNYTGVIDGIWSSANGNARVGEFT